jgi:hypothetical protein
MHAVAMHLVSWTSEGKPTSVGKEPEPEPELHGRAWQAESLPWAPRASPASQGPRISREPVGATDPAGVKDRPNDPTPDRPSGSEDVERQPRRVTAGAQRAPELLVLPLGVGTQPEQQRDLASLLRPADAAASFTPSLCMSVLFAATAAASAATAPSVQEPAIRLADPDRIHLADVSSIRLADPAAI